jgi:MFS family permease
MNPNDPTTGAAVAPAPARLLRLPATLRERDFRRFWLGETVSLFGDQITLIALPLVGVLELHASAAQMGYLGAAELFPNLIFSLHAGAWVDRRGRRRQTMIFTALGRAALLATIPLAYAFGALTLAQLYVVGFLVGTLSVFFFVSYSTLFVSLVPRERYMEATSLLNGSRAFSFVGGPSVGGLLVQVFSAPGALVADAFSFLFSAATMRSISPAEPPTEKAERGHVKAGIRYIWHSPIVRASLLCTATINFFNFVFWALFILYATRTLGVRPGVLGLVLGAASIGGVIGSLVTGRLSRRIGVGPAFTLGCVLFPTPLVLVPLAGGADWTILAFLFAAEFGSGLGVMILDIAAGAIKAALVPDRLRARVSGAYMLVNYGVRPVGSLVGGALGTWIGLRPTLWIASVGAIAGVLWLLPSPVVRLRELPEPEEAA